MRKARYLYKSTRGPRAASSFSPLVSLLHKIVHREIQIASCSVLAGLFHSMPIAHAREKRGSRAETASHKQRPKGGPVNPSSTRCWTLGPMRERRLPNRKR